MSEYKEGRGDYYLAAGKREERERGPRTESGRRFLAGWLGKNTPTDDWWRARETICEIEVEAARIDVMRLARAIANAHWPESRFPRGYRDPRWINSFAEVITEAYDDDH